MKSQVVKRYWESTKNGNNWYYLEKFQWAYGSKVHERQLGSVTRITDTRSANFNKWVTTKTFEENHMFNRKSDAMAYIVAMVALT